MDFAKKNMMVIALVVITILFSIGTGGKILFAQNINNLISQNGYVFVLATGMLCCILTGGNIDLAAGSVVCFTGAIGAVMMDNKLPMILAVIVMLVVGLAIGMFQGFWIAWVSVPPFIATLAGMYAFRGFSNVVLNGFAVGINDTAFLNVFGGGADCYVPDFLGSGKLNMTCMAAGIIAVVIYILLTVRGWAVRAKKGIDNGNRTANVAKLVVISALILWLSVGWE